MRINKVRLAVMIIGFFSVNTNADVIYKCTSGNAERLVSVVYLNPPSKTPCEVKYTKDGEIKTLWSYQNEAGNCETQATAFVEKQTGWGWQCAEQADASSPAGMDQPTESVTAPQ